MNYLWRFKEDFEDLSCFEVLCIKLGKLTKKDVLELCPSLSGSTAEHQLKKLTAEEYFNKHGNGKDMFYVKKSEIDAP